MRTVENFLGRGEGAGKIKIREVGGQFLEYLILSDQVVLEMFVLNLTSSIQSSPANSCSGVLTRMRIILISIIISRTSYGQSYAENLFVDCEIMAEFSLGLG